MACVPVQEVGGVQEIEHDNVCCNTPRKHRMWLQCVTVVNSPYGDNSITVYSFVNNFHHVQLSFPDIVLQLETNARTIAVAIDLPMLPRYVQHFPIFVEYNGQMLSGLVKIKHKDHNGHYIELSYDALNRISQPMQGSVVKIHGTSISWLGK